MRTLGSMFSGVGLLDLGLERAGFTTIWQSERDKQASKVLANRWPDVPNLGDVRAIDWSGVESPFCLSLGGWPCQPLSSAGKQLGRDDPRYLWPECSRALRALRPRMCVMEQSPNVLTLLGGDIFCEVLGDLAQAGFDAKWAVIPASDLGAPHERKRLFLAAYAREQRHGAISPGAHGDDEGDGAHLGYLTGGSGKAAADSKLTGSQGNRPNEPARGCEPSIGAFADATNLGRDRGGVSR